MRIQGRGTKLADITHQFPEIVVATIDRPVSPTLVALGGWWDDAIPPMLAEASPMPHSRDGWLYELKLDGVRALVVVHGCVFDGEIVVEDERGVPCFPLVQRRRTNSAAKARLMADRHPARFYAFDILARNFEDCTRWPLRDRKEFLRQTLIETDRVKVLPWIERDGAALYEKAIAKGFEGVMAKRLTSYYAKGIRSDDWQKIKPNKKGEFIAVGLTEAHTENGRPFGSIVLAKQEGEKMRYVGSVGSGLTYADLDEWIRKPAAMPTQVEGIPTDQTPMRWLTPEPIKVAYFEMTELGHLRFPRKG